MTETCALSTDPAKIRVPRKDSIHRPLRRHLHGDSPYRFTHPQARVGKPLLVRRRYFDKRSALSTGGQRLQRQHPAHPWHALPRRQSQTLEHTGTRSKEISSVMNIVLQIACFLGFYLVLHYPITDAILRKRLAVTCLVAGLALAF